MPYRAFYYDQHNRLVTAEIDVSKPSELLRVARQAVTLARRRYLEDHPGYHSHRGQFVLRMVQDLSSGNIVYPREM